MISSDSIIDLLLARNISSVILSGVGDNFLYQNVRYHCPIYAIFNFDKCKQHYLKKRNYLEVRRWELPSIEKICQRF